MGWKNYYKYASLIYDDPDILVPLPKTFLRDYGYRMNLDSMRIVLDGVAKYTAEKILRRAMYKGKPEWVRRNPGKAWLQTCKDLQIKWIHEIWVSSPGS